MHQLIRLFQRTIARVEIGKWAGSVRRALTAGFGKTRDIGKLVVLIMKVPLRWMLGEPAAERRVWVVITRTVAVITMLSFVVSVESIFPPDSSSEATRTPSQPSAAAALVVAGKVAVGGNPTAIAVGVGGIWTTNGNGTLSRVDIETRQLTNTIPVGSNPVALIVDYGAIWVADAGEGSAVVRIDPQSLEVKDRIPIGLKALRVDAEWVDDRPASVATAIATGNNSVWIPSSVNETVWRIDLRTNELVDFVNVGQAPFEAAFGFIPGRSGALWVVNRDDGTVTRVDPASMMVVTTIRVGVEPTDVATSVTVSSRSGSLPHADVWVANKGSNTVSRIDAYTNEVIQTVSVGKDPVALAIGADSLWVANAGDNTVNRIDLSTGEIGETIDVGFAPGDIAVGGDAVWITDYAAGTVSFIALDSG